MPGGGGKNRGMSSNLARSYVYCERLARREAGNFYHAFRVLPRNQRRAMCALYAFMRVTDDLSDGPGLPAAKRGHLDDWRKRLDLALAGTHTHALHPALRHSVESFGVAREYLEAVVEGVCTDLDAVRYATFADLYRYCYRVASVVGLACIQIWGCRDGRAKAHAESAGI